MKQNKLVKISNVVEADQCIQYLLRRPKMEMVGLGLIYGRPGLGKTTYAQRIAFQRNYVYLRLESMTTPKAFSTMLLTALYRKFDLGNFIPSGSTNNLFKLSMQILDEHPDTVIIIDEIDYAFKLDKILGAIRDIVDETLTIIILVGMQNAKDRLSQISEYYFDRCNAFHEFKPPTKLDLRLLADEIMDIPIETPLIDRIYEHAKGSLRRAIKIMHGIETGEFDLSNNTVPAQLLEEAQ
jgi:Cdc6-like AAA superfamily ATPase